MSAMEHGQMYKHLVWYCLTFHQTVFYKRRTSDATHADSPSLLVTFSKWDEVVMVVWLCVTELFVLHQEHIRTGG